MIFVTINSKGGVGKSTMANQILPAYLYLKNGQKTRLIEIDDENEDSKDLAASDILDIKAIHTSQIKTIDEVFIDDDVDTIIDVGGNKTATIFLNEMRKIGEFENVVWLIPIGQGRQDAANAFDTTNAIRELDDNAKIIYVLSNSKSDDLEWEYLHFFGNEFLDTPFAIDTDSYIVIPNSDIVNNAKTFNKTVYDISQNKTDFKAKAKEAKANGDDEKKRKYLFLNRVRNEAVEYIERLKSDVFPRLDELLA
jgi:cellulose biosynthesis protein BcsQ